MIHIFLGTKAQYIKTAPFIRLLDNYNVTYNLIDCGQHATFSISLRKELGIREPDVYLHQGQDIDTVVKGLIWLCKLFWITITRPRFVKEKIFKNAPGVCVVHGDTPSTLVSVLMAKRAKIKVGHIESGLRSHNYFNPFPEEIIRIVCMKSSDYLFAPNETALIELKKMGCRGFMINLGANTNIESLRYSLSKSTIDPVSVKNPFALVTFHRFETILKRKRIDIIMKLVFKIAEDRPVIFIVHPVTEKRLIKLGLFEHIKANHAISIKRLVPHAEFLQYLQHCDFVITDGGSIQEEAFYLNKPCLLMRKKTERFEGIGENVLISDFSLEKSFTFLKNYRNFVRKQIALGESPSEIILKTLRKYSN